MPKTGNELFVGWSGKFGRCESGVIWGAVPLYYVHSVAAEELSHF